MDVKYASKNDLKFINDYFKDAGVQYTKDDKIAVFEKALDVAYYLYQDNFLEMLKLMEKRKPIDENMNLIENLVDDLSNVFQSPNDGTYYVIK